MFAGFGHTQGMRQVTDFPHDVVRVPNVWIPLADGTRLAARIWRPVDADAHPVPAVLEYLPYRKDDATEAADALRHPYFAGHGYAAVRVDIRGTGSSDGILRGEYLRQEQDDALEVLRWLAAQPWCTGDVGMIGYSWGGFNGLQVAARRPPELKAVITHASTDDRYRDDCHYMGGCLLGSDMLKWATSMLTYTLQPPDPRFVGDSWRDRWLDRLREAPTLAEDWVTHQRRDAFWKHGSVAEDYGAIGCPVLAVGGWADAYTNAVPRLLEHLSVPRLGIIGPWGHMMPYAGVPGPAIGFLQEAVRWWDRWLKGIDNRIMDEPTLRVWVQDPVPPATYYAERPGRWLAAEGWPPRGVGERTWHARSDGTLADDDTVADDDTEKEGTLALRGAQVCGETAGVWCANGNPDEIADEQSPDDERSLTFTGEPLAADVTVLGRPVVRLALAVDRPRALVAARLCDVAPDGTSLLVSWGLLNLTHDESHEHPAELVPGAVRASVIDLRVCGHRFAEGHRMRLALSPTYWPHAWPSPEPVELTVLTGRASSLTLPVLSDPLPGLPAPFGPAEVAAMPMLGPDASDDRTRRIVAHPGGSHEIIDTERHERTVMATGARYAERARDVYSIREGDPVSARVACEREVSSTADGVPWSVRVTAEMHCTAGEFIIAEEYAASTGGVEVFRHRRSAAVARDHL